MTRIAPRRFALIRLDDETGVSGSGIVAYGVQFSDGAVALRWVSDHPSTIIHDSIENLERVHGHGGKTEVAWIDPFALDENINHE